ncbi:sugar ABC transporter ATP-binding protein [Saccharospirillum sp. HFRX-1]|uniref:sugar ABC transporter ATP-binding protein n=1 Tax=unclassified Saccharospirillum TaxID=2633430 RepID=UPI00371E729E
MDNENLVLSLQGVVKTFPGVKALNGVDFKLRAGEIHALLGENGAGKSTLIKVMTGVYRRDAGDIHLNGQLIHPTSTGDAQALGISTVYQEVNLVPNLSVAQNLFLGREPKRWGLIDWRTLYRQARDLLTDYDLDIDVTAPVSQYSVAVQQLVAIARGVSMSAQVLVLDEPTASLDSDEVKTLFNIMRSLRERGIGIVFVTHFLDQVYAVCDRITVLRNGSLVGEFEAAKLSKHDLVSHMLGKELSQSLSAPHKPSAAADAGGLLKLTQASSTQLEPMDLSVGAGEVVGLAGLLGSGRTEVCRLVFGLDHLAGGQRDVCGSPARFRTTRQAVLAGIGLCPEDRKRDGIFGPMSIRENIIMALQSKRGWWRYIPMARQKALAEEYVKALNIATSDIDKPIDQLSGGNQQKVILARWLAAKPSLLLLDEPTRGIDVGAHAEIIQLIRQLCRDGLGLLVASSELDELVEFSDRVVVLTDRRKAAEVSGADVTQERILQSLAEG